MLVKETLPSWSDVLVIDQPTLSAVVRGKGYVFQRLIIRAFFGKGQITRKPMDCRNLKLCCLQVRRSTPSFVTM